MIVKNSRTIGWSQVLIYPFFSRNDSSCRASCCHLKPEISLFADKQYLISINIAEGFFIKILHEGKKKARFPGLNILI